MGCQFGYNLYVSTLKRVKYSICIKYWCINWCFLILDPSYINERVNLVGPFDLTNLQALPESPTKRNRKIRRTISRGTQETILPDEPAEDSEDSETTRATHNVLERRRREELKEKFQRLRDCLPELQDNDRAPKVLILKKSCEYVKYLEQEEQRLLADKELEKQRLLILLKKRHILAQSLLSMQCSWACFVKFRD